jgi:hypothetical protein
VAKSDDARPRRRRDLAGVGRSELAADWVSPHRGYHRKAALTDPVRQRILDAATVMPTGAAIGGWAAAYLQGAAQLDGRDQPLLVLLPPTRTLTRPGITAIRTKLEPSDTIERHGISYTRGLRTGFDLLRLAPNLSEAVVAGDCMIRTGLASPRGLIRYAASHPHRRGIRQLRTAVPLLNAAAASPPESRLRMLCHLRTSLPPLLVNVPVYNSADAFLGIPDLLEPSTGLVIEYDGEYHRELTQHTADNLREESFESAGLTVVRVTALDLKDEPATAARLTSAYNRLLARHQTTATWSYASRPSAAFLNWHAPVAH